MTPMPQARSETPTVGAEVPVYDLTYISFGAGVQSTALLVCSALGLYGIPRADCAIFADPGAELPATYRHVESMTAWAGEHGIPVHRVSAGNLERALLGEEAARKSGFLVSIPSFTAGKADGATGMLRRQCTDHYKIEPIQRKVRELMGLAPRKRGRRALAFIGISRDEIMRMAPSRVGYIVNAHPLIDAGLTRFGCLKILEENGIPVPPKSACHFCPYHGNRQWRELEATDPETFARAVRVDESIRDLTRAGVANPVYLHRSLRPLSERPFQDDPTQGRLFEDGFGSECSGLCGV